MKEEDPGVTRVLFSPKVELGHLLQIGAMIAMVGGWAVVGYMTIEKQLANGDAEMALFKQRMTADEQSITDLRDSMRVSSTETRQQLNKILDQIADLRTLVAGQQNGSRR